MLYIQLNRYFYENKEEAIQNRYPIKNLKALITFSAVRF